MELSNFNDFNFLLTQRYAHLLHEPDEATPVGFEPTRGDPIGLAGRRLNRSAKVSSVSQLLESTLVTIAKIMASTQSTISHRCDSSAQLVKHALCKRMVAGDPRRALTDLLYNIHSFTVSARWSATPDPTPSA